MTAEKLSETQLGLVVLFGSGETSPSGRKIFDHVFRDLPSSPKISLLETPSGFELNSAQVVGKIAEFFNHRLQNFDPQTTIIPARKRGTPFSPDDPKILAPLLEADLIFMGPGSPSYAIRQLSDSLAWHYLIARHRLGATLALASAAVIAIGSQSLPVYEIYKVGQDLHWQPGLDLFHPFGLDLTFIPHWNNTDGGAELDTSRCFMGQTRFAQLLEWLPAGQIVIGIDEHTALLIDCPGMCCQVLGRGSVTLIQDGRENVINSGDSFDLGELGQCSKPGNLEGLPSDVWEAALNVHLDKKEQPEIDQPPTEVKTLVKQRQAARAQKDWPASDALRLKIQALGWEVKDTPDGPELTKLN
jgi:hypothetical protein